MYMALLPVIVLLMVAMSFLGHEKRTVEDHGRDCFWCSPRIPFRRRREAKVCGECGAPKAEADGR